MDAEKTPRGVEADKAEAVTVPEAVERRGAEKKVVEAVEIVPVILAPRITGTEKIAMNVSTSAWRGSTSGWTGWRSGWTGWRIARKLNLTQRSKPPDSERSGVSSAVMPV